MNRIIRIKGLSAIACVTAFLLWLAFIINRPLSPIVGALVAGTGLQSMAAFLGLGWALHRSNRSFYSIFVGDALLRLAGLGLTGYWLWSRNLPYTGPLLSLGFAYFLLSLVQVPFFYQVH
jgi:hypothetical protein